MNTKILVVLYEDGPMAYSNNAKVSIDFFDVPFHLDNGFSSDQVFQSLKRRYRDLPYDTPVRDIRLKGKNDGEA